MFNQNMRKTKGMSSNDEAWVTLEQWLMQHVLFIELRLKYWCITRLRKSNLLNIGNLGFNTPSVSMERQ